jgi:hypothetical protein
VLCSSPTRRLWHLRSFGASLWWLVLGVGDRRKLLAGGGGHDDDDAAVVWSPFLEVR